MVKRLNPVLWSVRIRKPNRRWYNITNRVKRLYIQSLRDPASGMQQPGFAEVDFYDPYEEFHPVDDQAQILNINFNGKRIFRQNPSEMKSVTITHAGAPVNRVRAEDWWSLNKKPIWNYNSSPMPQKTTSFVEAALKAAGQSRWTLERLRQPNGYPLDAGRQLVPGGWTRNFNGLSARQLIRFAQTEEGGDAFAYLRQDAIWDFKLNGHRAEVTTPPVAQITQSTRIEFDNQKDLSRQAIELEYPGKWEQLGYGIFYTNPETPIALKANVPLVIHATPISGGDNTVNTAQYEQNPQAALLLVPGNTNPSQTGRVSEPNIDYRANATANPESTNKTSVVTATIANDPEPQFTITLTATEDCYLTKLQARTFGLYILDRTPTRIYKELRSGAFPVHKIECYWTREHDVADAIAKDTLARIRQNKASISVDLIDSENHNIDAFSNLSIGDKVSVNFKERLITCFVDGHEYIYREESAIRRLQLRQA